MEIVSPFLKEVIIIKLKMENIRKIPIKKPIKK
jgi:hypothetical protein